MRDVAVIGAGRWGAHLIRNLHQLGRLGAVCDLDPRRAQAARALCAGLEAPAGAPRWATSAEAILAMEATRAVFIATPAATHAALAHAALDAGKHVMVEKPMALTLADARALHAHAQARGLVLAVGHQLAYHPAVRALLRHARAGDLGALHTLHATRAHYGRPRPDTHVLWDLACHDVGLALRLMGGLPERVQAWGQGPLGRPQGPDHVTLRLIWPHGAEAHLTASWLHPTRARQLTLIGARASATLTPRSGPPGQDLALALYPNHLATLTARPDTPPSPPQTASLPAIEPLRLLCADVLDAIARGGRPVSDSQHGLDIITTLAACQRSLDLGGLPVSAPHDDPTPGAPEGDADASPAPAPAASPWPEVYIHPSAVVDAPATIGPGTRIWHFSHVMKDTTLGARCVLGQNVFVASGVTLGDGVKVQNNVSLYTGVTCEDDVFLGPSMVFTNVINPRSHIERKDAFRPTLLRRGATVGANATLVCGATLGRYCMVGAGSVVTRDVDDFALVYGVPARQRGWVCQCGELLEGLALEPGERREAGCASCGSRYVQRADGRVMFAAEANADA